MVAVGFGWGGRLALFEFIDVINTGKIPGVKRFPGIRRKLEV